MPATNNPTLGYRDCPDCGERGSIHQAKGKNRHLYQRGCDCKSVQSNGKMVQSRLWFETQWLPDLQPAEPPADIYDREQYLAKLQDVANRNSRLVTGQPIPANQDKPEPVAELEAAPAQPELTETEADFDQDPDQDPTEKPGKKSNGLGAALALLAAAGLGFFALAAKARG